MAPNIASVELPTRRYSSAPDPMTRISHARHTPRDTNQRTPMMTPISQYGTCVTFARRDSLMPKRTE